MPPADVIEAPPEPDVDRVWTVDGQTGTVQVWPRTPKGWSPGGVALALTWPVLLHRYGKVYLSDPRPARPVPPRPWRSDGDGNVLDANGYFVLVGAPRVADYVVEVVNAHDETAGGQA